MTNFRTLSTAVAAVGIAFGGLAGHAMAQDHAFHYDQSGPGGSTGGHLIEYFELDYGIFHKDTSSEQNLFRATLDFKPEVVKHGGFWLAISDGPNPKKTSDTELAILYGDFKNERLTAYRYDGKKKGKSFMTPGDKLAEFNNVFDVDSSAFKDDGIVEFEINVTAINMMNFGSEWQGISFDEKIGVWFHFSDDLMVEYSSDGKDLTKFKLNHQGWIDFEKRHSTPKEPCVSFPGGKGCDPVEVSEPGTLALIGLGLVGLAASRRRKAA